MIGRLSSLCVLVALAAAAAAQAHDSGPAIARALAVLRQSPISVDPAAAVSKHQADALSRRLRGSTGVSVAILPVDFSLSAVGAARELQLHLARSGTVIALLGGDVGATSTDVDGPRLGALVRESQTVHNRDGAVPALLRLIDRIEAAREPPPDEGGVKLRVALVGAAGFVAASALALFALRRAKRP